MTRWTSPWEYNHDRNRRNSIAGERVGRLDRAIVAAASRARLPGESHIHASRHRRATTWIAEGRPIPAVQQALGHSTIKVTEEYVHLVDEHIALFSGKPRRSMA